MDALPQYVEPFLQVSSLSEMEREAIFLTVQMQRGNVSRIARVLGVSRTTLWRKLKFHGIDPAEFRHRD
jgi:transcriptional activator for dhaKLM operon